VIKLALFDLDHTLIPLDSDHAWGVYTTSIGWNDPVDFQQRNDEFYAHYKAGTLDIQAYVRFATQAMRREGRVKCEAARAHFMASVVQPAIRPQALALVREHQRQGDEVVIVTATNEFVTRPIAQAFGVPALIAVELTRDESAPVAGWITGEIQGTPSFREGKITRVTDWLSDRGLGWVDVESTFYSDSINDLSLLEYVTHPVVTNPDERLRAVAMERGWRILDLF